MLNAVIRTALQQRMLVIALALLITGYGIYLAAHTPIDVFPDLNRPRVVVMTEAPGMAPEEVESLITFPIETTLNGAHGVDVVRSSSGVGISVIYVEFNYGTDIHVNRQIVNERLNLVQERLPAGIRPQLAPISSIMGQILMLGIWSDKGQIDPLELRTHADWVVRQRILTIPGVAQAFTMGGGRKQYQVLVDPDALLRYGVTLDQVQTALVQSNENATGGYLDQQGPNELLVRSLGRIQSVEELKQVQITVREGRPVLLSNVARVEIGAQVKRGDSAAYVRNPTDQKWMGGSCVVLTINKQPGADTRQVTDAVLQAIDDLQASMPAGVHITPLYAQKAFIDRAIYNVLEALRDGVILVIIVLFAFLMNIRTTLITLTAIPLSLVATAVVFAAFDMSINTMTLGGLAVALGELVDDAIVDVENIFRRLRENRLLATPRPTLLVIYEASVEVRSSIVYSTIIVCLVFIPLFALTGMEGRLFAPLGTAYIVSILASLFVSLTVTPVLSYWLLGSLQGQSGDHDGFILAQLKRIATAVIGLSLRFPRAILLIVVIATALAAGRLWQMERDFLPPFNEGSIQLNLQLPPGTSLSVSNEIAARCEAQLKRIPDIIKIGRRTGRAELDEHAEGVNTSEFLIEMSPNSHRSREAQVEAVRSAMSEVPGVIYGVEQPISHLISHMLSGVKAQVGIKIFGDDLDRLRQAGEEMERVLRKIPGVTDLMLEPQVLIPQLRIELKREKLLLNGITVRQVNELIETALHGAVVSEILEGQRAFDLVVRFENRYRENLDALRRLSIELPQGGRIPLEMIANVYESGGPNTIHRENVHRRIVLQCNVTGRGVVDVVHDIQRGVAGVVGQLPTGYHVEYGGQFQSQQAASRILIGLFSLALLGVFLTLFTMFRSVNLSLQVMAALPMAFIGSVAALAWTGQTLTIANMVGFISLAGIASRNGILLLNHYLHLVRYEGEDWTHAMLVRAGQERLAPVLMTALTAAIGLIPLVLAAGEPGKEILYPVATVILGGVISSTLLDFFVHPALFWLFGRQAAQRVIQAAHTEMNLRHTSLVD